MTDVRFYCEDCGVKWFVRDGDAQAVLPGDCAVCGGALRPLATRYQVPCPAGDESARGASTTLE